MKKLLMLQSFFWCFLLAFSITASAQNSSQLGKTANTSFMNPLQECTGGIIYDDGSFENGYGWNTTVTSGDIVMMMTPDVYPFSFSTFCAALTRNGAATDWTFDIVVFDNTGAGGAPGNLVATVPGVTATGIPTWPTLAWYDFDISSVPALASGSYYIGIQWDPVTYQGFYIGSDESGTTNLQPGYASADGGATWATNQTYWAGYRAMGMRALGGTPCDVESASNPNPANGATDVPANLSELTWTNGTGAVTNETYFGTDPNNLTMVQSGTLASSYSLPGMLDYFTTYYWKVVEVGDTCNAGASVWSFKTEQNPLLMSYVDTVWAMMVPYGTGTTDQVTKTDTSEVRTADPEMGWMVFDLSNIPMDAMVDSIRFYGYVNNTNWPYWSATPLRGVNPITDDATMIADTCLAYYGSADAYIYSNESSSFGVGYHNYLMGNGAAMDMQDALAQGWFPVGIVDRDFSATYFVNWDGWAQANPPYIVVNYSVLTPVELSAFTANVSDGNVVLNWSTATETNNKGFEVQRKSENGLYNTVAFVSGNGTTTERHDYNYVDSKVSNGKYTYRLRQVDFDGTFEYSKEVTADVSAPTVYQLQQNYPNPFNPSTQIDFSLAVNSKVSLKVFDVLGRQVAELINNNLTAGVHNVNFNAKNLTSGVYFYRLEAKGVDGSNFTSIKKMILTK